MPAPSILRISLRRGGAIQPAWYTVTKMPPHTCFHWMPASALEKGRAPDWGTPAVVACSGHTPCAPPSPAAASPAHATLTSSDDVSRSLWPTTAGFRGVLRVCFWCQRNWGKGRDPGLRVWEFGLIDGIDRLTDCSPVSGREGGGVEESCSPDGCPSRSCSFLRISAKVWVSGLGIRDQGLGIRD